MMNRIVHFEIQVDEPGRAMDFYKKVFGWSFEQWGDNKYWVVMTAPKDSKEPGINGGLLPRTAKAGPEMSGANAFVCTIQVDNYDDIAKKIMDAGGKVVTPKYAFPGMAWQGYYLDPEDNTFGLHQADPNAK